MKPNPWRHPVLGENDLAYLDCFNDAFCGGALKRKRFLTLYPSWLRGDSLQTMAVVLGRSGTAVRVALGSGWSSFRFFLRECSRERENPEQATERVLRPFVDTELARRTVLAERVRLYKQIAQCQKRLESLNRLSPL